MRKLTGMRYTAIIFAIFFISLFLLAREIFSSGNEVSGQPGTARLYQQTASVSLGRVEVKDYQRMGFTRGIVRFAANGKLLAAGTENGDILIMNQAGQKLWSRQIGVGKISALEFSRDNRLLFVGESSADGNLYCFDAATGKELWRYSTARELGADIKSKSLPGIVKIAEDQDGNVYIAAQRTERPRGRKSRYYGKIYSFTRHGQERWLFPRSGEMDAWVNWFSVDAQGERLVFGTANFETDTDYRFGDNIYCLDAVKGVSLWSLSVPPIIPYQKTVMRASPNIASDGKQLAAMASDGRALFYDADGGLLWQRTLSRPKKIGGVYLNSVGRDAFIVNDKVIFSTTNTYNNANWQLPTPVEHPSSNSLFIFSLTGELIARWQVAAAIEEIAFSQATLVAAVGRNTKTKDPSAHGVHVLNLSDGMLIETIHTEGPAIAVAVSPDGNLAAMEAPLQLDDGRILGEYRLHIWRRNQ